MKQPSLATPSDAATDQLRSAESCRSKSATTYQRGSCCNIDPHSVPCVRNTHRGIHCRCTLGLVGRPLFIPSPYSHARADIIITGPEKWAEPWRSRGFEAGCEGRGGVVNVFLLLICRPRFCDRLVAWPIKSSGQSAELISESADWK